MSRNRMKNSQSLHWMGVIKWILIAGLLAGLGLCYMLRKNENLHLAEQTQVLQETLDTINARNDDLQADLRRMKSLTLLERRLALMHSVLVPIDGAQVPLVRLDQNTRARLVRDGTLVKSSLNLSSIPVAATSMAVPTPSH